MKALCAALALLLAACGQPGERTPPADEPEAACEAGNANALQFVPVPSGQFRKAAHAVYPEEGPEIVLRVEGFEMLAHEVTNAAFTEFVESTGYVTAAERSRGQAGGGSAVFRMPGEGNGPAGGWALVEGATWRTPEGPGSDIAGRDTEPVVHVSLQDAEAYAAWAGGRLPTEIEWEYAAAIGLADPADPVSGAYDNAGVPVANTWQGVFPLANLRTDGHAGRAPAGCFPPSAIGLYDMLGNVWEWTATPFAEDTQTIKGGSYLCADNYCRRYRPAARQPQERDFSASHIGFRIVRDAPARDD